MDWLEASERAAMRADLETFLAGTCTIAYATTVLDAEGAPYRTWTAREAAGAPAAGAGTAIPCRLVRIPQTRQLDVVAGQITEPVRRGLWLAWDQACAVTDRVTIGTDVWEVREVDEGVTDLLLKRVIVTKEN